MKKLLLSLLLMTGSGFAETLPSQIVIGFTPSNGPEVMIRASQKLTAELTKQLGTPVKAVVAKSYDELLQMFSEKKVDFAFLTSQSFVEGEKQNSVKVLLKKIWDAPFYYSVIFVKENSGIKKIADLKNRRVAFVDRKSASGYLYPQVLFKKSGLTDANFQEIIYSGSHPESVSLLEKGKVDAIAIFSDDVEGKRSAWQKFVKDPKVKVRKLWSSEPIPNDPFCVRQDFYDEKPKFTHTMMFTLIDVVEGLQNDSDVKSLLGANGFQPATSRQYDAVREMVQTLGAKN